MSVVAQNDMGVPSGSPLSHFPSTLDKAPFGFTQSRLRAASHHAALARIEFCGWLQLRQEGAAYSNYSRACPSTGAGIRRHHGAACGSGDKECSGWVGGRGCMRTRFEARMRGRGRLPTAQDDQRAHPGRQALPGCVESG